MSVASLNATLEEQKRLKYDAALEAELRKWMASVLGEPGLADGSKPLQQLLKDGSVLCRLANKMHAGLVTRINASGLAFKQMENITHYLSACQILGFQPGELFDTTDLYEDKDMMRVLQNVNVLRKFSEKFDSAAVSSLSLWFHPCEWADKRSATNVSKLVSEAKEQAPLASGGSGSSWGSTSSKGRSKSSVLSRPTVQRNAAASAPNSPALTTTATGPAQAGPTHKRSGSAYSRTPTYSLKSNDSSSSGASLGSPSTSRAAVIEVSSLHDDVVTKEEFKYSLEVEGIAQRWIEAVLKDKFPAGVTFANALKSGVILCRLINAIKPGSVSKINTANIAYLQMENIEHYLKACAAFGLRNSDLFDTTDLFEAKKMSIVLSHIVVLGNTVKKLDTWRGPVIEDSKHAKNLWAESLNMNEINEADLDKAEENKPIPPEQQEWIDWINDQLAKRSWKPIKNLTTNLKSGVVLNRLLEVLLGQDVVYVSEPKYLWQYINNVTVALRVLAGHTFELVPGCTARDIVNGNVKNVMVLMNYLRDKFDLEFLFNKVMGEDIDDDEMDSIESDTLQWSITPTWLPEPPAPPIHAAAASSSSSSSSSSTPPATPSTTPPATPEHKASPRQPAAGFIGRPSEAATSPRRLPGALDLSPRPTAAKPQQQPPAGSPRVSITPPASPHRTGPADAQPILSPRQTPTAAARAPLSPRLAPAAAPAQKHHTAPVDTVHEIKPQPHAQPQQHAKPDNDAAGQAADQQRPLSPRVKALTAPEAPAAAAVDGGVEASPKRQPRTRSHREKKEKKLERLREKSMSDRDLKKQETVKRKEEEKGKRREEKERKKEEKERKKEEKKKRKEEKKKQDADTVKAKKGKHRKAAEIVAPAAKGSKGSSISKGTKKASIGRAKGAILAEETHAAAAAQPASTQHQPTTGPSVASSASAPAQVAQQPKPAAATVAPLSPRGQWGQPAQQAQPQAQPQATRTAAVPSIDLGTAVSATGRPVGPGSAVPATGTLRRAAQAAAELKREKARIVVRKRVVDEILSTEASYVRSLEIVVKQVLTPLRRASAKVLSDEETEVVFMNIAGLLTHHLRFLDLIKERVSSWSPRSTIGDVFLFNTDFIKEYGGYLNKYNTALVTMRHLVEKRPAFKKIKEAFELEQLKTTSLTLDAFLIMPVQRLPRYVLLLKELLKYSNQTHPDYAYLERAHAKVKAVLDELNRGIDEEAHVRVQKIISIEDDIEGLLEHLPDGLYHPQRTLVREGLLNLRITHRGARRKDSMRSFQKQYYFFAFNDLIVCCGKREPEKASKGGKGKGNADPEGGKSFRYAGSVRLSEVVRLGDGVAVDNDNAEAMQSKLMHIQFAFHVETEHVAWTLVCSSEQEKQAWLSIARQGAINAKV